MRRPASVVPFTQFAASILPFLDDGLHLDVDETRRHLGDGSLLPWLALRLGPSFAAGFADEGHQREVASIFAGLDELVEPGWNRGVRNNGLCVLLGYAVEACRQANLEQRWSDY